MLPFLAAIAATQEGVILAEQAVEAGLTAEEIRRLVRQNAWTRIRHGAYVETARWAAVDENTRHRLLVRATLLIGDRSAVVCDRSAVAWHRLDTLTAPPPQIHLRMPTATGGRSSRLVIRHGGQLMPSLLQRDGDVSIVNPEVAAVELACVVPFHEGVVVCDSALRSGAAQQELVLALAAVAGRPGAPRARRAVAFADGRAGSAGESLSRVVLREIGWTPKTCRHRSGTTRG